MFRARHDRVLYRAAPPPTGNCGVPRKDGNRFQRSDLGSHGSLDDDWSGADAQGRLVQVTVWGGLQLRQARAASITAVRIIRARARNTKHDPRESWFWWLGGPLLTLAALARIYPQRFGQEHGYRCDKQDVLLASVRMRTPKHIQR